MTLPVCGAQETGAGSGPAAPITIPAEGRGMDAGMRLGEGRGQPGELPGAEEWPRAEEGALELNFLSLPWGWDLCCHLQGDAGCVAAGIPMVWKACGEGLRAHWGCSILGSGSPQDLLVVGRRVWRDRDVFPYPWDWLGDPLPAIPVGGGRSLLAPSLPRGGGWFLGTHRWIVEVALGHPPLQALPGTPLGAGFNCGSIHWQ